MKSLCTNCFTSNVECQIYQRRAVCNDCYLKLPILTTKSIKEKMKYDKPQRHKERWDEKT